MNNQKFDSVVELLAYMLATNTGGKSNKQVAMDVRPDLSPENAKVWLSLVLNPTSDRNMGPDDLLRFAQVCGNGEVLVNYLCDALGLERPSRKLVLSPEKELRILREALKQKGIDADELVTKGGRLTALVVKKSFIGTSQEPEARSQKSENKGNEPEDLV